MNYPQQFEELYEEELHIFQSYPLLSIFPVRNNPIQLTPTVYSKIYKSLTCTLCGQLMELPVYLKCAHRFCKECIQRHVRSISNKTCPYCKNDQILSKNDLKIDDFAIDFAHLLFQDAEVAKVESSKQTEDQQQSTDRNSSIQVKLQQSIQQLSTQQIVVNLSRKRGRPKKIPFLWNQSIGMKQENNKIEQQEFQQPQSRKIAIVTISDSPILQHIVHSDNCLIQNKQSVKTQIRNAQLIISSSKQQPIVKEQYQEQVSNIKIEYSNHYGKNYFNRLAEITTKHVFIQIKLLPNPHKPFTPALDSKIILCSPQSSVFSISRFVALQLNVSRRNIRLYVKTRNMMKEIYESQKLCKINQKYWSNNEFNLLDLSLMFDSIQLQDHIQNKFLSKESNSPERIIYFEIEFEKRQYPNPSRKQKQ